MHLWLAATSCLFAAVSLIAIIRTVLSIRRAPPVTTVASWPKLSLIVPACNEADTLEAATRDKLSTRYPNLELVLVNDRSTDATGEIADRLAAGDLRIRVVHITALPDGWLGKVHALARGAAVASGELLLFSDADVHFAPETLERVVAACESRGHDFVTLMPRFLASGGLIDLVLTTFLRTLISMGRCWKVEDQSSRAAAGGGIFNMVRRSALERSPGIEWLRMEVADDVAFGQMMKHSGARCALYDGTDDVSLYYYRSVGEAARGLEKNAYAMFTGFNLPGHFACLLFGATVELGSLVGLLAADSQARLVGGAALLFMTLTQTIAARWLKRPLWTGLVPWLGPVAMLTLSARSAVLAEWRSGIVWRGTSYSLTALRAGRRLSWF